MMQYLCRPPHDMVAHAEVFEAIIATMWNFPKNQNEFRIDQLLEFFADCVFYDHLNFGLCREIGDRGSHVTRFYQSRKLEDLSEAISKVTNRSLSIFDIVESCAPVQQVQFKPITAATVIDWFLCEVISGAGFCASDEEEIATAIETILGPGAKHIDLSDSAVVTANCINRLNSIPVVSGFFSYALYEKHALPFKIAMKEFLDKVYLAAFDTPYSFIREAA